MKPKIQCLQFISVLSALLFAGCSATKIQRVEADGTTFTATNHRFIWKSAGVDIDYSRNGTNVTAKAKLDQSGTDADALRAAVEGAVAAGIKAATQTP